jgi:hypothetical protein
VTDFLNLYETAGFGYIPLNYPIADSNGVKCSCGDAQCQSVGKHPLIKRFKTLDFSNPATYKQMRQFWQKDKVLNVGLLTDSFSVIDVDFRNAGHYSLGCLQETYEEISNSLSVSSGDGFHIYLSNTMRSTTNFQGLRGIDIRGKGGYIVAPPSIHKSLRAYRWRSLGEPAVMPSDLRSEDTNENGSPDELQVPLVKPLYRKFNKGERNTSLFALACGWRNSGCDYATILRRLSIANQSRTSVPLQQAELERIAKSAIRYPTQAQKDMGLAP